MARVLLVAQNEGVGAEWTSYAAKTLDHLGMEYERAWTRNSAGNLTFYSPADGRWRTEPILSDTVRAYLRTFDAVLVSEIVVFDANLNGVGYCYGWLNWKEPEDPPVLYFGVHFGTARSFLDSLLPSDFPLVRPNPADINSFSKFEDGVDRSANRSACAVWLTREEETVYAWGWQAHRGSPAYTIYPRLNLEAHWGLDANGEILAQIAFEANEFRPATSGTPAGAIRMFWDTVVAYRYYQHLILPTCWHILAYLASTHDPRPYQAKGLHWLLLGLKWAGIPAKHPLLILFESDHPMEAPTINWRGTASQRLSRQAHIDIQHATYGWWADFNRMAGAVSPHGVQTGRHRGGARYRYYRDNGGQAFHADNVAWHKEGVHVFGFHDHTIELGSKWRFGDTGWTFVRLGNANLPMAHGARVVNANRWSESAIEQAVSNGAVLIEVEGNRYVDFAPVMSGTGTSIANFPERNYHSARMVMADMAQEMTEGLGFPDYHCGVHRYTNHGRNWTGGLAYEQAMKEAGFRGMRYAPRWSTVTLQERLLGAPLHKPFRAGLTLIPAGHMPDLGNAGVETDGLYYTTGTVHADSYLGIQNSGDFAGWDDLGNQPTLFQRAYRRWLGSAVSIILTDICILTAVAIHPGATVSAANPGDPASLVDWDNLSYAVSPDGRVLFHVNGVVEYLSELWRWSRILSGYVKWSNPTEMMDRVEGL